MLNGYHINYETHGKGRPAILIHGIAASLHDWEYLTPALNEAGYETIALDLLGHGDSDKPDDPGAYNFDMQYAYLEEWIAGLKLKQRPLMIGHSLGGFLSLNYARYHPEDIEGLVLVSPFYQREQISPLLRLLNRRPDLGAMAWDLVPKWLIETVVSWDIHQRKQIAPSARQQIVEDYKRASPNILHLTHTIPEIEPDLPKIKPTTLVLWGEKDHTLDPTSFPVLVNALPNAVGKSLPGSGHQPHLSRPKLINNFVVNFLQSDTSMEAAHSIYSTEADSD
jgi:2-succinyl-6-hydroxy-2,4-cyclohexadiene-1-carboxylate synthase